MAESGIDAETKFQSREIIHMYETVLNHTYAGKVKKTSTGGNNYDNGKWQKAKTTYLVCEINGADLITKTNISGQHAETQLIEELIKKGIVKKRDIVDDSEGLSLGESKKRSKAKETEGSELLKITVYINNSPCSHPDHNCTGNLISILESNVHAHLELFVTNLYNIQRESCNGEYHNDQIDYDTHKANYIGLRKLMQHERCEVKAFTEDVWKRLFKMITDSDELPYKYDTIEAGNERSREYEDELIQRDLTHIKENSI